MSPDCPFCGYLGPSPILYSDDVAYVIEPLYPVVPSHRLVVPFEHVTDFADDPDVTAGVARLAAMYARKNFHHERAFNLISSKGRAATQTVDHLHLHLVPREDGDGLKLPWT